ncbi:hypothetical protein [Mesorhizobium temperatum]|nr:hypothetical protein [Mesorhizobium temperatum]
MPKAQGNSTPSGKPLILFDEINRAFGRSVIDRSGAIPYVLGLA